MKRARQVRSISPQRDIQYEKALGSLCVEPLEGRIFLSGNVLAQVADGSLTITGDAAGNVIFVNQTRLKAGEVRIFGDSNTTVNSQSSSVILKGITGDTTIRMNGGADSVSLSNMTLLGNLRMSQGALDSLTLDNVNINKALSLRNSTTQLATNTTLIDTVVGKDMTILSGDGAQNIVLSGAQVHGDTSLIAGKKVNTVRIDDSVFRRDFELDTGSSADTIQIEANGDAQGPPTTFDGTVVISMGGGDDTLQFGEVGQSGNHIDFANKVHLDGGLGNNSFLNLNATFHNPPLIRGLVLDVAPTVSSTDPGDTDTDVAVNGAISATFSEAIDPTTINTTNVTVVGPDLNDIAGTVSLVGTTMTFTPATDLAPDTTFLATIGTGVTDSAGTPLANDFVWTFTTGAAQDTTAPTVSSTDPANSATAVSLNKAIAATFSEAMQPTTMTPDNVTVTGPGSTPVVGTVGYVDNTVTFTPTSLLAASTVYTVTINTAVKDLAGNPLASDFVWSFTTGTTSDTTPPTVSSTDPANSATGVMLNKAIAATFSESMDPATLTNTTYTLTGPGSTPVAGTVTLVGTTATFTPTSALAANTTFTATISTAATDLAGNALAAAKVWTFTTGSAPDITPPTVSSTSPLAGAIGVALNAAVAATFSESMDASTITNVNYTLKGPGNTAVAGTVTLVGTTATFTPTSALAANTTFTATISTAVTDLAGNPLAAAKVWSFTTGAAPDTTPPTVSSTDPADAATGVTLNKAIAATFSESMDASTITNVNYTLKGPGNTAVAGTVTLVGTTATFTPTNALAANTTFTATISTAATDLAGNPLAAAKVWSFTTGAAPDTTPPTVSSTDPADTATAVTLNKAIAATFSESMAAGTISTATYTLTGPGSTPVAGSVTLVGTTATFTPTSNLAANTTFTATISTAATDLAGNPLAAAKVWTFTTGAAPDTTPPTVSSTDPADAETGVALNKAIAATFSESMDASTITNVNYTLTGPGSTPVAGTVTLVGTTATFTPTSALAANTTFTATISTAVTDLAGNPLAAAKVWSFTTGAAPDTTPPTVSSTDPADAATGVNLNKAIAATFSESMAAGTISTATFTLTGPGNTTVSGTVTLAGTTATFTPSSDLAANTTFTATISTAATDLAGNPLATAKVWTFTTGAAPDTTPPTVASTAPTNNGTNVSVNSPIQIEFSEPMNASTITTATITVSEGGTPVAGTVTYNATNNLATFTPSAPLDSATTFSVTIVGGVNGVTDLAGNPLATDFNATFTTEAGPDTTPPTVTSSNPADGDVGVDGTLPITATFSEAMDASTITTATITVTENGGGPVAGTVSYDAVNDIVTFTPSADLDPASTFTVTISGGVNGVTDLAGNPLAVDFSFTFTTA